MRRYKEQKPIVSPFFISSLCSFNRSYAPKKHITPIAATQLLQTIRERENGECVFIKNKNTSPAVCKNIKLCRNLIVT